LVPLIDKPPALKEKVFHGFIGAVVWAFWRVNGAALEEVSVEADESCMELCDDAARVLWEVTVELKVTF